MINRVTLIGRLVADPEIRYTQSGLPVANFRIAVDRIYKNADGERDTDFIRIVAWRKTAELVQQYLVKGRLVGIDGSLQSSSYQTKEGDKRTSYEVQADQVQFLEWGDKERSSTTPSYEPPPPTDASAPPPPSDSDLPF